MATKEREASQTTAELQSSLESAKREVDEANTHILSLKEESEQVHYKCNAIVCIYQYL